MQVMTEIENYASNGFRTLTFAMKILETDQIDGNFSQEEIESNFTLLGASCVEDLLQTDVSRCLNDFKQAKI
jgi:magnesium-transporting ATPase (P-type)